MTKSKDKKQTKPFELEGFIPLIKLHEKKVSEIIYANDINDTSEWIKVESD